MITGANTNVRHRGVVYHVQTEDSGRANPRIISHLYHGGTILASVKTDYGDRIDHEDLEAVVRGLIETQHQEMLDRLKRGGFDAAIAERLGEVTDDGLEQGESDVPAPEPRRAAVETEQPSEKVAARPAPRAERAFGEGIVSQKPLDEVILEYLAEKARGRAADRADRPARKTRSSG
jgi:hypothetical protein